MKKGCLIDGSSLFGFFFLDCIIQPGELLQKDKHLRKFRKQYNRH